MLIHQTPTTKYIPHYKPNQLFCGYGQTALITGWTVKESLAKKLSVDQYAVIGNLYSATRGISPLIRNLLLNPHVRYLVLLNATKEDKNSGSCQCLFDFFLQGFTLGKSDTSRDCWVINSTIKGYIDREIPANVLENLRQAMSYKMIQTIKEAVDLIESSANRKLRSWAKAQSFPHVELTPTVLPGPRYGHRIEGQTIAQTWVNILHRIKTIGTIRPTEYGQWQELIDLVAIVTDEPKDFYFPEPNYLPLTPKDLENYIPQILNDAPYTESVKYTYGQRLRSWFGQDQIECVINKLIAEPNSARAVMNLWDSGRYAGNSDHDHSSPPCLNHIWVRIVEGELSLTATFRSNDMFSAWPSNAMGLRALQHHIFDRILKKTDKPLTLGPLITISQSAHIYSDCWEHADKVIQSEYKKLCNQQSYTDPTGSFLISIKNGTILVEHLTPGSGEVINCYSGKSAHKLYSQLSENCPSLNVKHALYLGTELQKAEIALSFSKEDCYTQDQPLKV